MIYLYIIKSNRRPPIFQICENINAAFQLSRPQHNAVLNLIWNQWINEMNELIWMLEFVWSFSVSGLFKYTYISICLIFQYLFLYFMTNY